LQQFGQLVAGVALKPEVFRAFGIDIRQVSGAEGLGGFLRAIREVTGGSEENAEALGIQKRNLGTFLELLRTAAEEIDRATEASRRLGQEGPDAMRGISKAADEANPVLRIRTLT